MVNHKKEVTKESICKYLHLPISKAAESLNISTSVLKKRCRSFGISNWPYRKIRSVDKKIARLRKLLETNPEYAPEINSEIARYTSKRERVIEHPELVKLSSHVNVARMQKQSVQAPAAATLTSPPLASATLPPTTNSSSSLFGVIIKSENGVNPQQQQQQMVSQKQLFSEEVVDDSPKLNLPPLEGIASVLCSLSSIIPRQVMEEQQQQQQQVAVINNVVTEKNGNSNNDVDIDDDSDDDDDDDNDDEIGKEKLLLPPCSSFDSVPPPPNDSFLI